VGETASIAGADHRRNKHGAPSQIAVDGLEINRTGTSQNIEMNNLHITSSVIYNYTILPLKAGHSKFRRNDSVAGRSLSNSALTLHVVVRRSAARSNSGSSAKPSRVEAGKLAFAELIVPKQSAFVGEIVPVQIRLGFDPRARPRLIDGPEIDGQGFTAQKLQQSGERVETTNGKTFDVVTFKSAIAAARPGKFEIGPVKARVQVSLPRQSSSPPRRRSPFDMFDLNNPFFSHMFALFIAHRECDVE
jgi:hypothetical protein